MTGSSTPDGDGWYGYKNDGFFKYQQEEHLQ